MWLSLKAEENTCRPSTVQFVGTNMCRGRRVGVENEDGRKQTPHHWRGPCTSNDKSVQRAEHYDRLDSPHLKKGSESSSRPRESLSSRLGEESRLRTRTRKPADPQTLPPAWPAGAPHIASWAWMFSNPRGNAELSPLCHKGLMFFDLQLLSRREMCSIIPRIAVKHPRAYLSTRL